MQQKSVNHCKSISDIAYLSVLYLSLKYAAYLVSAYFCLSLFFGKLLGNATRSVISYKSCKIVQFFKSCTIVKLSGIAIWRNRNYWVGLSGLCTWTPIDFGVCWLSVFGETSKFKRVHSRIFNTLFTPQLC